MQQEPSALKLQYEEFSRESKMFGVKERNIRDQSSVHPRSKSLHITLKSYGLQINVKLFILS